MDFFEEIKLYSPGEDHVKLVRCVKNTSTGKFHKVSLDIIYDPYDNETLQAQNNYFLIGLFGAIESSQTYDSLEELIISYNKSLL